MTESRLLNSLRVMTNQNTKPLPFHPNKTWYSMVLDELGRRVILRRIHKSGMLVLNELLMHGFRLDALRVKLLAG